MTRDRAISQGVSIWVVAAQLVLMFALSTLPTPLYETYAQQFHFSNLTLTLIFAAYVIGTLSTLFFLGRLSDQIGRRRVSLTAIGLAAIAAVLFLTAQNAIMLTAARIITGLTTGLAAGTAIAWIRDLHGPESQKVASLRSVALNIFGLGFGPLLSGLLAAWAPWPERLTYAVFLLLLLPLAVGVFRAQETVQNRPALSNVSLKPRIGVPRELRLPFMAPAITIFVAFSLVGFYSVIAPNLLATTLHLHNYAITGSIIFELFLAGAVTAYLTVNLANRTSMLSGAAMMLPTLICLVLAQEIPSLAALLIGTALGGASVGLGYRGALEIINQIAPEDRRAEMVSSLFVVGNLSLAIPVIGIGILAVLTDPRTANLTFAAVIALFSIIGLLLGARLRTTQA